jgi:hypothetical protein
MTWVAYGSAWRHLLPATCARLALLGQPCGRMQLGQLDTRWTLCYLEVSHLQTVWC